MPYIHFTEEQKRRANAVDLPEFLRRRGEKLLRSGPEFRLDRDHSVTVRGNEWYDHAAGQGGGPVSFFQNFYGMSYPEAMSLLLDGEQGVAHAPTQRREEPRKEFALPPANADMRRVYAYLMKQRCISRDVISAFAREGTLYEDVKYHNAVFVGKDERGVPRHAHKRSTNSEGRSFRANVDGSLPQYSFHWAGPSDRLYVFEAPIDLLSFLTRYPKGWQEHSFVALCGTTEHAMLWMLEQNQNIRSVCLCLDHDAAGIEAAGRLTEVLYQHGYDSMGVLQPEHKDWNEDLKATHGLPALEAEEHPQLIAATQVCRRIGSLTEQIKPERLGQAMTSALQGYQKSLQAGRMDAAMDCMEMASALALFAYGRELRQMGQPMTPDDLSELLRSRILPHQNRGAVKTRYGEIAAQMQDILTQSAAPGIRTAEAKEQLAESWLALAVSLAKIPIKYDADILKNQKQEQVQARQQAGPVLC